MSGFFGPNPYNGVQFSFMGTSHVIVILTIVVISILTYKYRERLKRYKKWIRMMMGVTLLILHITKYVWLYFNGIHELDNFLPLHLSSMTTMLMGIILIINHEGLCKIIYFWAMIAGLQATFVPELEHGFNHLRFYQFFIDHALLFYAPFFMTVIYGYRPTYKTLWKSYFYLFLYALFVMMMDFMLDVNYMILKEKPSIPTPLDYMGDWPYYLIFLVIAELAFFHLLYLPFVVNKKCDKVNYSLMELYKLK